MKIKNNRGSSIVLIFMVIGIFFTLLYYAYLGYSKYKEVHHTLENIELINKIEGLLSDIDKERIRSAIYMGTIIKRI